LANQELKHEQSHQLITHNKARLEQRKHVYVFYNFDNSQLCHSEIRQMLA